MFDKTTKGQKVAAGGGNTPETGEIHLSFIAKEMHIEGNCVTDGQLRIEGKISGNVTVHGIELVASGSVDGDVIAAEGTKSDQVFVICGLVTGAVRAPQVEVRQGGRVHGGVVADEAVIHGQVHGGILARNRLTLEETADVEGDVHARRLALKEGGQVNGNIRMGERADVESSRTKPAPVAELPEAEVEALYSARA